MDMCALEWLLTDEGNTSGEVLGCLQGRGCFNGDRRGFAEDAEGSQRWREGDTNNLLSVYAEINSNADVLADPSIPRPDAPSIPPNPRSDTLMQSRRIHTAVTRRVCYALQ